MTRMMTKLFVVLSALTLALTLMACSSEEASDSQSAQQIRTSESEDTIDNQSSNTDAELATYDDAPYNDTNGVDFTSIDRVVASGDLSALESLVTDVNNQPAKSLVVQVDGTVGVENGYCTIVVSNNEGTQSVSMPIEVVGFSESDYPSDDVTVQIVGVTRVNDKGVCVIVVPKERFIVSAQSPETIKLSDASIVVPQGWRVIKDDAPTSLIIVKGNQRIEFWCGNARAAQVLNSGYELFTTNINGATYTGYTRNKVDYELVTGTLNVSSINIYLEDLEKILEYNVKI